MTWGSPGTWCTVTRMPGSPRRFDRGWSTTTVDGSTLTFEETAVPFGTWYYKVIAADAAGNSSEASEVIG